MKRNIKRDSSEGGEAKTKIIPTTKTGNPIIAKNAAKVSPNVPIASRISPL